MREHLDEKLGGGEQVSHVAGRALCNVQKLVVTGRQQKP
jgi:hypothetical protein